MEPSQLPPPADQNRLADQTIRLLMGFFGGVAVFLFVPLTIRYLIRRFIWGFVGKFIAMITFGFLLNVLAERLQRKP